MTQKIQPRPRIGVGRFAQRLDKRDVSEPVEKLLSDLDDAFGGVEAAFAASLPPVDQRAQHVAALRAVERFLMDVDWVHAERFAELAEAIEDLNIGARHPLLLPIMKTARPLPSQIWRAKAAVVCAINFLALAGAEPKDAAKKILHDFPAIKKLATSKSHSPHTKKTDLIGTILGWRKSLHAPSRGKANAATAVLHGYYEFIDLELDGTPEQCREMARKYLRYAEKIAVALSDSVSTTQ
jgi:hypothetical protein